MAKIVDPDSLNKDTEIVFNTTTKTIQLVATGNLEDSSPATDSGVTEQAVYSKCKELWKSETDLNKLRFPFDAITPVKMDLKNGWTWEDATTEKLVRDGGWSVLDAGGTITEEFMNIISLGGDFAATVDTAYYQQISGFDQDVTDFQYTDALNEHVWTYHQGTFDYTGFYKVFLREQGKLYDEGNLVVDQDLAALDYTVYKLPLVNATDINIEASDATIDAHLPYTNMQIDYISGVSFDTWVSGTSYDVGVVTKDTFEAGTVHWYRTTIEITDSTITPHSLDGWEAYPGEYLIGDEFYAFNRIVHGATASLQNIYEFTQRELRQTIDINDDVAGDAYGTIRGNIAGLFSEFVGDILRTKPGVFINDADPAGKPSLEFFDITEDGGGLDSEGVPVTSTKRTYPWVSSGNMVFNDILVGDTLSVYTMYFKEVPDGTFDQTSAIIVNDDGGTPISGSITLGTIAFDFDYENNVQGSRTSNQDADVIIVAIGLSGAQWIEAEFAITRNVGLNFPVNAVIERNYENP